MLRKLSWVLAFLALCCVPIVYSLGLGELNLHSGINQPLSADIKIHSLRARDADSIKVLLGSDHDFASAGLQRPDFLNQLRFSVEPRGKQSYVIHVSTEQAVREPLLDFLIQVTWPGGQLLREYTASLSPPVLTEAPESATQQAFGAPLSETELATVQQEETPRPQAVATADVNLEVMAKPEVAAKPIPEVKPEAGTATEPEVITTPAIIAKPVAATELETASKPVVVAKNEAATKPKAAAKAKIITKSAMAGSRTEYGPVRPGETLSVIANRALPYLSLTANQKMQAILRANPAAFIDNNINNLKSGRILRLPSKSEISAINPQQANLDTRAQLDAWQRRQGIAVAAVLPAEKPVPAVSATDAQPAGENAAPKPTAAAEAPQAAITPQAQLKLVPPSHEGTQTAEPSMGTGAREEPSPDDEAVVADKLENQDLNTRIAALEQQLTTIQKLMALKDQQLAALQATHAAPTSPLSNPDILLAIIGVLTAGLIAMLLITMRRPQPMLLRDTQPPSAPQAPPRAATPSAPAKYKTQAPQPAAQLGDEPDEGINAEIDVYIAYGRYHQAEGLIRETMIHNHSDELKLKLLEVYYAAKNAAAFEEAASNLREEVDADTELWRKVVPMGRELCPKSTLFAAL